VADVTNMDDKRVRLYHYDNLKGVIYTNQAAIDAALNSGWVDAPWKVEQPESAQATEVAEPKETPAPPVVKVKAEKAKKTPGRPRRAKGEIPKWA
jgi:hypothetical protein